jgi:hypothetical protein
MPCNNCLHCNKGLHPKQSPLKWLQVYQKRADTPALEPYKQQLAQLRYLFDNICRAEVCRADVQDNVLTPAHPRCRRDACCNCLLAGLHCVLCLLPMSGLGR